MSNNEDITINEENKKDEEAGTELKKNEMQSKENRVKELEKKLEEKRNELEKRENELKEKELKYETLKLLQKEELNEDFYEFIIAEDIKAISKKLERFKDVFSKAVQQKVEERLRGKAPTWGTAEPVGAKTADIIKKAMKGGK